MKPSPYRDFAVGIATASIGSAITFGMLAAGLWQAAKWLFDRKVPK